MKTKPNHYILKICFKIMNWFNQKAVTKAEEKMKDHLESIYVGVSSKHINLSELGRKNLEETMMAVDCKYRHFGRYSSSHVCSILKKIQERQKRTELKDHSESIYVNEANNHIMQKPNRNRHHWGLRIR